MASMIGSIAATQLKNKVSSQVKTDIDRVNNNAKQDSINVKTAAKTAAYKAFLDISKAISESVSDTETVALGNCLNRCKTDAKDMISSHNAFKLSRQSSAYNSEPNSINFNKRISGGSNKRQTNKRRTNKRRTNKRRTNKRRTNKKYY
jgi:hypothetical protein